MSPRPKGTDTDETAEQFLTAAADLMDLYLQDTPITEEQTARLKAIKFPAALEWLRKEDVIRLATSRHEEGRSKKAFRNRWETRDEFLAAAIKHAMTRKQPKFATDRHADEIAHITANSISDQFIKAVNDILDALLPYPRTYLLLHIAPLLPRFPDLHNEVLPTIRRGIDDFAGAYKLMLDSNGLVPRPEWPIKRIALSLQAMLDGFCLRPRIMPDEYGPSSTWKDASLFADTVIAFTIGIMDWEKTGEEGRAALDRLVGSS